MKKNRYVLAAIFVLFAQFVWAQTDKVITSTSVDKVKLGMTVAEVRKAIRPKTIRRTTDGEGVALIEVKEGKKKIMSLYAGESNPESNINQSAKITNIEVWSPCYKTAAGVYVGMPLKEVEQHYGNLKEIYLTEIESREYAEFEKQPKGLSLRVYSKNGTAGIYPEGSIKTKHFRADAYVLSILVH